MILTPKNWTEFQHYKDREPSWIKLHKSLLTNYEFVCLPVASKALAPMLWLLASEYKDGIIDASLDKIAFRLSMTRGQLAEALSPLIESGFFDASEPLAEGYQPAIPEKEREIEDIGKKEEEERETRASALSFCDPPDFDEFWACWPNRVGRRVAVKAYGAAIKRGARPSEILTGIQNYIRDKPPDRPWLNPATFLNQNRWEDRPAAVAKQIPTANTVHQQRQQESRNVLDQMREFNSGSSSGTNSRILRLNPGDEPGELRGGAGGNLVELSPIRTGSGG